MMSEEFKTKIKFPVRDEKFYLNCCKMLVRVCENLIKRNKLFSQQLQKIKSQRSTN